MFLSCSLLDKWDVAGNTAALACLPGWLLSGCRWSLETNRCGCSRKRGSEMGAWKGETPETLHALLF